MINGRVVYVDQESIWLAQGRTLLCSRDGGRTWAIEAKMPMSSIQRVAAGTRLGRRLGRIGIHHFSPGHNDIAIVNRSICLRRSLDSHFSNVDALHGSRPLALARDGDLVCYGEYRSNHERSHVNVWGSWNSGEEWVSIWRFDAVRHIHGVFLDPYTGAFWITTGDDNSESGIWVTFDRFRTVDQVLSGSQQTRAVTLCFTEGHVYFGSDTPLESNYLYRLSRESGQVEKLQRVGSSVFFGCKVAGYLFFSTAAEPSKVNAERHVELWCSSDGENWTLIWSQKKDFLPSKLFQYGQVQFPAGPGDGENLFFTPFATAGDQRTWILPLEAIGQ